MTSQSGGRPTETATILDRIVDAKRDEVRRLQPRADALDRAARAVPRTRDFEAALRAGETVRLIAEVKRRSPGAGRIRPDLDPAALARAYEAGGASAVSVLTDGPHFGGSLDDLAAVRAAVALPVLRKDFVIDPLQLLEARAAGADAVLLIVRILDDALLARLHTRALELGMAALVEAHDAEEVERALAAGARILGVNNRDLRTFGTNLDVTFDLVDRVPGDVVLVSESGIGGPADVDRLGGAGVDAVLVGEWLVRRPDPTSAAVSLSGSPRGTRHGD